MPNNPGEVHFRPKFQDKWFGCIKKQDFMVAPFQAIKVMPYTHNLLEVK